MKKPSFAMISFLALATLAVGLSAVALLLSYTTVSNNTVEVVISKKEASSSKTASSAGKDSNIDTTNWATYSDDTHGVSFKHPDSWKVKTYDKDGLYIIVMEPEKGKDHVRVYVTSDNFFAVDGLQLTPTKINKLAAVTANDVLVGIRKNQSFFTFDLGADMQLKPEFWGMLNTVVFNN